MSALRLPARPTAVLFDLDGTLCDSEAGIVEHLAAALSTVGLVVPPRAVLRRCVGPAWHHGLPEAGVPPERLEEVIAAYRATYDLAAPGLAVPFLGISEALDRLLAAGLVLAVATQKRHQVAQRVIAESPLAAQLDVVVGADVDAGRLTKAGVIGAALVELGGDVAPATVVMVGDRSFDVEGAAAHGVATIGVAWGCAEPDELEAAGAAVVVATPAELVDRLLGGR